MPGFADSFWSGDYAGGLGVLFGKLQQGVAENHQVLTIARMRAEAEDLYGIRLGDIGPATDKISNGFSRDDGASVRKAYEGVRGEMLEAAMNHKKIASNIRELVVNPFTRWCDAHESRVQNSQDELLGRVKLHDRQAENVRKLRSQYFNKCRLVEDIEEENKLAFQDPSAGETTSPKQPIPEIKVESQKDEDSDEEQEALEIGDDLYQPEQVKRVLTHMIQTVTLGETKVPILGTYQNVTAGADIVEYLQKHMGASSVSQAERIGQDLIGYGFLRLVGNVGNVFANSSKMYYQWRPKAFQMTGIPEKKAPLGRTFSLGTNSDVVDSPVIGSVGDYLAGWNPLNNQYPNETPGDRLRREAAEADARYKAAIRKLDLIRCQLEEAMIEHFKFMERCELDRLKAIKSVILDFSGAISNVIPSLQSTVDKMMLYQETVQPLGDLRYLLENYRTGGFAPKVQVYDNYYNSADEQTFGVDLEARARSDKKRVPSIVTTILTFLDNHYPDLEGDDARRAVWLVDVPLAATHHLRNAINDGKPISPDLLERYEIPIVASALKLYLLELPDSLVSCHVYEIMKTIYTTTAAEASEETRISVLQNTLTQLRLSNIATLDALMTHFTRLIELTSADEAADEAYTAALAQSLAPCILRPRVENALTMEDKHAYRLIRDLFAHKGPIFSELKRASSLSHSTSVINNNRPRAISTDESGRKANVEARNRAIAHATGTAVGGHGGSYGGAGGIGGGSRSRATSPAPGPRGHRRDRSSGGPETRFPVNVSSPTSATTTTTTPSEGRANRNSLTNTLRHSLDVPGNADGASTGSSSSSSTAAAASSTTSTNATDHGPPLPPLPTTSGGAAAPAAEHNSFMPPTATDAVAEEMAAAGGVEKRNSLGRSGHVSSSSSARRKIAGGVAGVAGGPQRHAQGVGKRDSARSLTTATEHEARPVGVSLTDAPMDD